MIPIEPLCKGCKRVPPEPGRVRCADCLAKTRASVARASERRRTRGYRYTKIGRPKKFEHFDTLPLDGQ